MDRGAWWTIVHGVAKSQKHMEAKKNMLLDHLKINTHFITIFTLLPWSETEPVVSPNACTVTDLLEPRGKNKLDGGISLLCVTVSVSRLP